MDPLPLEILLHIATRSFNTFKLMLALPPIARFLMTHKQYLMDKFTTIVISGGYKRYLIGKLLHREDGPAIESDAGYKAWYWMGKLHRGNGLPAVIHVSGDKEWWVNGKKHRIGGPASIFGGYKSYYINGRFIGQD